MTISATRIRTVFLHPKPTYTVAEAAALLGMTARDVREWMDSGELEGVESGEGLVLPWPELVSFAMDFWSQEAVEEALGADVTGALPALLRLTDFEARIPRMDVVALERVAALDGATVSDVLARELRDFVSAHLEWLSQEVPGFAEALAWPELPLAVR
jgi:excisionase family DNA binding protein